MGLEGPGRLMLFQLRRELRRKSLGFGVVGSNCLDPVLQFFEERREEPREGESTLCSAQGTAK